MLKNVLDNTKLMEYNTNRKSSKGEVSMVEEKYETKEQVVVDQVLVCKDMFCDICKKEIKHKSDYWEVTTHHHDWGNDSIESYKCFDICSVECLKNKFNEYCDKSSRGRNTNTIEVERSYWQ